MLMWNRYLLSGFSETDRVKNARQTGIMEYIQKPYRIYTVGFAVKTRLKKSTES
jgi:hypothetical protein